MLDHDEYSYLLDTFSKNGFDFYIEITDLKYD